MRVVKLKFGQKRRINNVMVMSLYIGNMTVASNLTSD